MRNGFTTNEKLTAIEDITNYNNFYEFSTDKQGVAIRSRGFCDQALGRCGWRAGEQTQDFWSRRAFEVSAGRTDLSFALC